MVKDREWNRFKLTVIGKKAELEINGKPAWKAVGLKAPHGYIALQAEVPGGGRFLYRNIRLTELGHRPLFNGKDLTGWNASECWEVQDGAIVGLKKKGPTLLLKEQVDDFNLRLEYRVDVGANSGVFIRVPMDEKHKGKDSGIEIQILEDTHHKWKKLKPFQFCGSLYGIVGPSKKVGRKPGEWNEMEINANGDQIRVTHNGIVIVNANAESHPALAERLKKGFLGFQNHGGGVAFRNVRIGPAQ